MIYLAKTLEAVWNILKLQMVMRVMENYGPKTTALVKLYQSQNGAAVNGQIDEATLNKLRKGEWKVVAPSEGKYVIRVLIGFLL